MFYHFYKHLEVCFKYTAARRFLNSRCLKMWSNCTVSTITIQEVSIIFVVKFCTIKPYICFSKWYICLSSRIMSLCSFTYKLVSHQSWNGLFSRQLSNKGKFYCQRPLLVTKRVIRPIVSSLFFEDDFANRRQVEQKRFFSAVPIQCSTIKSVFSLFCSWRFNSSRIKFLLLSIVSAYFFFENYFTNRRQVEQKWSILAMIIALGINSVFNFIYFFLNVQNHLPVY